MGRKFNIAKFVDALPREAELLIRDVYCPDMKKNISELTIRELVHELSWAIEKAKMDLNESEDVGYFSDQIKEMKKSLKRLERLKKQVD